MTPPTRPAASVGIASPWGPLQVAVRATASYAGLTSSFATAAKNSEYANRISNTSASLWDLDITLPELTLSLPWSTYVSATTNVRSTRCVANFTTVKNEALDFTGWALSVGVGAAIAYRLSLGDQPLAFDFFTGVGMPLTSLGWTDLAFKRTVSTTSETFSEADLVSMLDSLQPYVQDISKQPTIEAGARATWRF